MLLNIGITRGKIKYTNDNNEVITITESNGIKSIKIYDEKNVPEQGFIGQATGRQADIELIGVIDITNLENKEIEVFLGADYNNQSYYINYGKFIINQAPENDTTNGTIKITAFDYMIKFNDLYKPNVQFPCKLKDMLDDICTTCGVTLATQSFANMNFISISNQFDGKTNRDVLKHIGKCAFSWARIGQDNRLYLDFVVSNTITETLTIEDYYQDKYKRANEIFGPINRVVYAESNIQGQEEKVEDTDSIALNGLHELVIYDNYFAYTTAYRQELIQAGTRLFGLTFMPIQELNMVGLAYLECTDRIQIIEPNNLTVITIPFNHIIEYNGTLSDNLSSTANTKNEIAYKNTNSPMTANSLAEIIVDRAMREIRMIVNQYISLLHSRTGINNIFINNIPNGEHYITNMTITANENIQNENSTLITEDGDTILTEDGDIILLENELVITIIVSEGSQDEETVLITEDGDTILTEDENVILSENKSLYVFSKNIVLDGVLRSLTINGTTYYDELQILQDGTVKVIRRIGVSQSHILYLLDKEKITILDEKIILPSNKNGYYYYIKEIDNLKYYAEYIIENEYSNTFSTIVELQSQLQMLEDAINLSVSEKYETIKNAETVEKEIKASLNLKVNTADLISEINASADIIRLIGQRLIIQMQNYSLDESGFMTAIAGQIAGFSIQSNKFSKTYNTLYNFTSQDVQLLMGNLNSYNSLAYGLQSLYDLTGDNSLNILDVVKMINIINGTIINKKTSNGEISINSNDSNRLIEITNNLNVNKTRFGIFSIYSYLLSADIISLTDATSSDINGIIMDKGRKQITVKNGTNETIILPTGITTPTLTQTSRKDDKKDFELLEDALQEVINTDIYKYHLRSQEDEEKKHIGFVIGENFNYSHLITAENLEKQEIGVDTYSMISVLWKAVQEQQKQIEELQNEIKILRGEN